MECKNICKIYNHGMQNEQFALKNINLKFGGKGLIFIIGKSGSGKSTLLNILAGLDKATSGSVIDGNVNLSELSQDQLDTYRRNNIGFVFQNYNLINELNVKENIMFCNTMLKNKESKADDILKSLNIFDKQSNDVKELSGGQQQRVSIGRALYKYSKIILADEPTGNLDKENSTIIFDTLKKISKKSLIIVVTHDNENAIKYGDRVITLEDGQVVQDLDLHQMSENSKLADVNLDMKENLIRYKFKTLFKLAYKFMNKKKLKLVTCTILTIFVLNIIGLLFTINNFKFSDVSISVFNQTHTKSIGVCKGYINTISHEFNFGPRPIDKSEQDNISRCLGKKSDKFYAINGMKLCNGTTGSQFLYGNVDTAVVSSKKNIWMYDLSMKYGYYPQSADEIAISDYLAYSISILKPEVILKILDVDSLNKINDNNTLIKSLENLDRKELVALFGQDWENEISKQNTLDLVRKNPWMLLLYHNIDFYSGTFKISAILHSNYEKYSDMIYMKDKELNQDKRKDAFTFSSKVYYYNFYVNESFISKVYSDGIILYSNAADVNQSFVKKHFNMDVNLKYNEVYMSSNFFRSKFKEEFNPAKTDKYLVDMDNSVTYGSGGPYDVYFHGGKVKVVGVFDMPKDYEEAYGSDQVIIFSDEYFKKYALQQTYCWMMNGSILNKDKSQLNSILQTFNHNNWYYYNNYSKMIYELDNIMQVFKPIFLLICIIICVFSILLMYSYFSSIVTEHKREIGIMKALGLRKKDNTKIFMLIGGMLFGGAIIISSFLVAIGIKAANKLLADNYLRYVSNTYLSKINILSITVTVYLLIIFISMVLLVVSIILPLNKIAKIQPIDNIRNGN